jgi:hypothetical protein
MSFDFLPKNVFKGRTSDGKKFEAFEYSFEAYALRELGSFFSYLFVGGFLCAIASPIILVMLMLNFTGRFNIIYLLIPIFSGYFIYDCANGWLFSLFLNIFIEETGLIFLTCLNISCISVILVMTIFGKSIYNYIINKSNDAVERYVIFFVMMGIVFALSWYISHKKINHNWLGVSKIQKEETVNDPESSAAEVDNSSINNHYKNTESTEYYNENNDNSNVISSGNEPMDSGYNEEQRGSQENTGVENSLSQKEINSFDYITNYSDAENVCQSKNMRLPTYTELIEINKSDLRVNLSPKDKSITYWTSTNFDETEENRYISKVFYQENESNVIFHKTFNPFTEKTEFIDSKMKCNFICIGN